MQTMWTKPLTTVEVKSSKTQSPHANPKPFILGNEQEYNLDQNTWCSDIGIDIGSTIRYKNEEYGLEV